MKTVGSRLEPIAAAERDLNWITKAGFDIGHGLVHGISVGVPKHQYIDVGDWPRAGDAEIASSPRTEDVRALRPLNVAQCLAQSSGHAKALDQ